MVTDPLDDSYRTAVTDTKPLAHLTVDVHFASRSPVKQRIAGDDVLFRGECGTLRGTHDDLSAREPLAEVVVRIAFEREGYAFFEESTETLSGRAVECDPYRLVREPCGSVTPGDLARKHRSYRTVRVTNRHVEMYRHGCRKGRTGQRDQRQVLDSFEPMVLYGSTA